MRGERTVGLGQRRARVDGVGLVLRARARAAHSVVVGCATLAALCGFSAPAHAQRDGVVEQVILDTMGAHLQRRGYSASDPLYTNAISGVKSAVTRNAATGSASPHSVVAAADRTFGQVMKGLGAKVPWPVMVGIATGGYKWYPDYGTRTDCYSASTTIGQTDIATAGWWCPVPVSNGMDYTGGGGNSQSIIVDCGQVKIELDPAGFLIAPSYPLKTGRAINYGQMWHWPTAGGTFAKDSQAVIRRSIHLNNLASYGGDKKRYLGIQGTTTVNGAECVLAAGVSYRDEANNLVARTSGQYCPNLDNYSNQANITDTQSVNYHPYDHFPCPKDGGGGTFHYYGAANGYAPGIAGATHLHECIHYIPNNELGESGYAINPKTTHYWNYSGPGQWPAYIPEPYKSCLLDPSFIKRLTDALYKDASQQSGYAGAPYQAVADNDVRNGGNAQVKDLADTPGTGPATPTGPGPGVDTPTPPTTVPTTPTTQTDVCDFGPTGCDNPGTPAPTLEQTPTGIMDPIFDWLPDLPSITFDTNNSECPVWGVNLQDYFGPEGVWILDSHCDLMEQNRAAIGALMVALFGVAAAFIILRA